MSMAVYEPTTKNGARSWVALMAPAAELADAVAGTDFVPKQMRNNAPAIAACILYGDEVGLGPMFSLGKIHIVEGRPTLAAEAMRALILAAGHELWFEEQTVSKVTIAGRRRDSQKVTAVTWTLDDARRANLAGKLNWRTYPRQMLAARATAELARLVFADVTGGLMATEELEDVTPPSGPEQPESSSSTRRRRRTPTAAAPPPPPRSDPELAGPPLPGEPGYDFEDEYAQAAITATTRRLHAQFRERDMDRDQRLRWTSDFLGRKVTSFNDLSPAEADHVARQLAANPPKPEPDLSDPAEHEEPRWP